MIFIIDRFVSHESLLILRVRTVCLFTAAAMPSIFVVDCACVQSDSLAPKRP